MENPSERREIIRHDRGGFISGPSITTEQVPAREVQVGNILLLDDGTLAEVTDIGHGFHWFPDGRQYGVAIGWKSPGTSSGLLFRKASDILHRVPGDG